MTEPVGALGHYVLDKNTRRLRGGHVLLGGEPPRLVRLSAEGKDTLDRLLSGDLSPRDETGDKALRLAERLTDASLLHRLPEAVSPTAPSAGLEEVTVVVPVLDPSPGLEELLVVLVRSGVGEVVVVDDGSSDGGAQAVVAVERTGARAVLRAENGGPGAARNSAGVKTAFVAYLDSDVVVDEEDPSRWLGYCLAHFSDERVALVAPRVKSEPPRPGGNLVESYEELESPLDMGAFPGIVGRARRLSYVPAAALVARTATFLSVGGFDEALRYGEDVDLLRRIEDTGDLVRYEPRAVVSHRPRTDLSSFARQRYRYGTAASVLERRHEGTVPPFAASAASALSGAGLVLLLAAGAAPRRRREKTFLALALVPSALVAGRTARRLSQARSLESWALSCQISSRSALYAFSGLLAALRRAWWPFFLPGLFFHKTRRPLSLVFCAALISGHGAPAAKRAAGAGSARGSLAAFFSHLAVGLLDDASYALGVLAGCRNEHSYRALRARITLKGKKTVPPARRDGRGAASRDSFGEAPSR